MKFDAVLFDCDGVLVDSEPITSSVLREMLGELGWHMSAQECLQMFVGKALKDEVAIMELVNRHSYWDKEQERLKNELRTEIVQWVAENVKTEEDLKAFLSKNNLNTNQLQAIARGARFTAPLSDDFLEMFAAHVSAKSKGTKYERTPKQVITDFYAVKGR